MSNLEHDLPAQLPPAVREQLDALRDRIRSYVWLEGLAAVAVWLGAAFWGSMALDWSLELPRPVRVAVLAVAGAGLAVVLFLFILRRAFVRLSDGNMATILERQFPQLNDSLLTLVSHSGRASASHEINPRHIPNAQDPTYMPQMLSRTGRLAQQRLDSVRLGEAFNPMPIVRKVVIALGLALAAGLLAAMAPSVLDLWAQRNLLLADTLWPRKIRLEALGFTDDGEGHLVAKVAAGANFDLRVQAFRADTEIPVVPEKVEIRYQFENGGRERKTMKNIGHPLAMASAADEPLQEYGYAFTGVLNSVTLDIAGGDARIYPLKILVVPNPTLNLQLVCEYPRYMERAPLTIDSVSGAVPVRVPVDSTVTVAGTATKPLEKLEIDCPASEGGAALHQKFLGTELANQKEFTYTFNPFPGPPAKPINAANAGGKVAAETNPAEKTPHEYTLQFTLRDCDGLKARDPILLTLVSVPDEAPEVKVRLVGTREPAVTPKGRLPVTGTLSDDHGLSKAWFAYTVEERALPTPAKPSGGAPQKPVEAPKAPAQRSGEVPLAEMPKHQAEYVVKEADVKASELSLSTGQKLTLAVRAADLCTFGNGPNIGSGESWLLDVVSEDELVTRLEARELLIKQRYEQIVEEMTETRNLLLKMDFTPPEKEKAKGPKPKLAGAEPGEREEEAPKLSADELNKRRLERTLQALQNCRKNSLETADVAAAIEEIRVQLDNNQANNETRKQRIEIHVLQPLHVVVESMFPVLDQRIVALQEKVDDLSAGPGRRDSALKQADLILAKMLDVLDHMMKTEDFNINVVQRLKKIIERQKELTDITAKAERDKLKD